MDNQIRCAVVTMAPFPGGNVSTLRYSSYLKALIRAKHYALVLIYTPTTMAVNNKKSNGIDNGIEFQYATRITWGRHKDIFTKIFFLLLGLFKSIRYIRNKRINTLILYGENLFIVNLFYKFICALFSIKFIGDRSEYPSEKIRKSNIRLWLYKKKNSFFDGMIVMTYELLNFYSNCTKKSNFTFLLPMTIDAHRFDNIEKYKNKPYIAVVFGTHNRDGLMESIQSYLKYVIEKEGTYDLVLIGDYESMPNKLCLDSLICKSGLSSRIIIKGKVPISEVPSLLYNASCLLTTPNFYVSGGFPTKLGEYMLSGVPVVVTNAGEITYYVENLKEAFIANPGDINCIAEKLLYIECNYDISKKIAENARIKALKVFCADTYVEDFTSFLMDNKN